MSKCPKCGAEGVGKSQKAPNSLSDWKCGSFVLSGTFHQTDECRIRELTAENERLRAELSERKSKMTFEEWEKMDKDFGESLSDC